MRYFFSILCLVIITGTALNSAAAGYPRPGGPPLAERWFGIYVDRDRVGFYRQKITASGDGYHFEGDGSVRMKIMGFSKEASMRESYQTSRNLALRSCEIEQAVNGVVSRVSGTVAGTALRLKVTTGGRQTDKQLRFKGELFPGPALNLIPMLRDIPGNRVFNVQTFDAEDLKVKEVRIKVLGEGTTPDGQQALRLRNNLYPFVDNDIWVDGEGNTLLESVRDGLVITKAEDPKQLGGFIGALAVAKKDLIYDFSMVRVEPPLPRVSALSGLRLEITGWSSDLPLLQEGGQAVEKSGEGRITVRTGSLAPPATVQPEAAPGKYLLPADRIEADAPELVRKANELAAGRKDRREAAAAIASWTAGWLKDTVEDGGGALASFRERSGNCQTHARLYTALARAAGIPTRFVSGLVYQEGQGFLYHSWAESFLEGVWTAVDPTYDQLPADPTHIKFFEGHTLEDLAPIVAVIGRIRIRVLETASAGTSPAAVP